MTTEAMAMMLGPTLLLSGVRVLEPAVAGALAPLDGPKTVKREEVAMLATPVSRALWPALGVAGARSTVEIWMMKAVLPVKAGLVTGAVSGCAGLVLGTTSVIPVVVAT